MIDRYGITQPLKAKVASVNKYEDGPKRHEDSGTAWQFQLLAVKPIHQGFQNVEQIGKGASIHLSGEQTTPPRDVDVVTHVAEWFSTS